MEFPDLESVVALGVDEYERDFIRVEYGPGLRYHLQRIDQLLFRGDDVLDAGAGAGQWSIALAQRFSRVKAIDLKESRLKVLRAVAGRMNLPNIAAQAASIEDIPFPAQSFDAVFCYGVVMFTDVRKSLGEFFRVLKPGGRVYLCLNADGWSKYLIEGRGKSNAAVAAVGRETLYKTAWHRARARGFGPALSTAAESGGASHGAPAGLLPTIRRRDRLLNFFLRRFFPRYATDVSIRTEQGHALYTEVLDACGPEFGVRLLRDLRKAVQGEDLIASFGPERAYQPREFGEIAQQIGFDDFQWAPEAGLICQWTSPQAEPKYEGYYRGSLAVWECLLTRPSEPKCDAASLETHFADARTAQNQPVYFDSGADSVISNMNRSSYPQPLLAYAEYRARRFGGNAYLRELCRFLASDCKSEEERFRKIMEFVQMALYRDPISQPINLDGTLPEPAVILFSGRGRCGHVAKLLTELLKTAGIQAEIQQLSKHVSAKALVDGRWVVADADAFKHGVVPTNRSGQLLSYDDLKDDPYLIDRFPPTGWFLRPGTARTAGHFGRQVIGYVDALEPEVRGFVSGYYSPQVWSSPPPIAKGLAIELAGDRFRLSWEPTSLKADQFREYRVYAATASRQWSYADLSHPTAAGRPLPFDVLKATTTATEVEGSIPTSAKAIFASVVTVSNRLDLEAETFFWPSEELACEL